MNRLFTRLAFMMLLVLGTRTAFSQSISLEVAPSVTCFGKPLQIKALLSGVNPNDVTSYVFLWGNGDSTVNFTGTPVTNFATKQYAAAGIYNIRVTANFSNRGPLTTNYWDTVYNLPIAAFSLTSQDSQCFTNNVYCFKEAAQRAPAPSLPLKVRFMTYGDGATADYAADENKCHSFTKGGIPFNVGYSVTDEGGCASQSFRFVFVGNDLNPRFAVSGVPKCDTTPYVFINQTPTSPSNLLWFKWDFDDGSTFFAQRPYTPQQLAMWSNFTHWYTKSGVFNPKLVIKSAQLNCSDSFTYSQSGNQLPENIIIRYDLRSRRSSMSDSIADSVCIANLQQGGVCLYNMYPLQGINTQIAILWDFADPNANPPGSDKFVNQTAPCYKYLAQGHFFPKLYVQCPGKPIKRVDFWSRVSLPDPSDTHYVAPPIANPILYTIGGYLFKPGDDIAKYRWIGSSGILRDSITSYWKFFTDDSLDRFRTYRRGNLLGFGVNVLGPTVAIENPMIPIVIKPQLKAQCLPSFPIEFVNASSIYQSHNLYIKWDFGDEFAPKCTSFSTPNPGAPNGGMQPYTNAIDLANRSLPRFVTGGRIYPGGVNCAYSHDTLPIHRYERWATIYQWYRFGKDFPPYDSTANGWTLDPSQVTPNGKKLVAPVDTAIWGKPMFSSGPTPSRLDTLARMWPQDFTPNRPVTVRQGPIPDPIANSFGYWELTLPNGTTSDTSGFLKVGPGGANLALPPMPNGVSRRYRGNTVIPGMNGMTMYQYIFNRTVQTCPTVTLLIKDSINNQSTDPYRDFTRIDMTNSGLIIIQQKIDTAPGAPLVLVSDTFSRARKTILKDWATKTYFYNEKANFDTLRFRQLGGFYYYPSDSVINPDSLGQGLVFTGRGEILRAKADTIMDGSTMLIQPADSVIRYVDLRADSFMYVIYNRYKYQVKFDPMTGKEYILFPNDHFNVDAFDCGGTSTLQLPLVGADAFGFGRTGIICPDLRNGESGGRIELQFGRIDSVPGTYPNCGGRTFMLFNYDSLADRTDGTPCQMDGFVQFDGTHPTSGAVTPGGNTWPAFNNAVNFNPMQVWTGPGGTRSITHYKPTTPWPYTNSPVDPRGYVTVGLILGSGCNGTDCSRPDPNCLTDTVWYHKFLHLITLDATFTFRKVGGYINYGVPSRLPSQDYTYDSAKFHPTTAGPLLENPTWREPWNRLYGKGDILEFETYEKEQDFVLADIWDWGDGTVTIDSFYTNKQDTFVKLNPSNPNDSLFFEKHTYPINRLRFQVSTRTFPYTILSSEQPYPMGVNVYKGVRRDTIWRCDDPTRAMAPQLIKITNLLIDTAFFLKPVRHQFVLSSWEMPVGPGSSARRDAITPIQHILVTTESCLNSKIRQLVVGVIDTFTVFEGNTVSDGIFCIGQEMTLKDSLRYWFPKPFGANNVFGPTRPLDFPADYDFPGGEVEIYNDNHGRAMGGYPVDSIKTFVNYSKYYKTTSAFCPFGWIAQAGGNNTTCYKIDTAFFERIYWDFESDGVVDFAGKNAKHTYKTAGKYKVSMITRDTVGYYDTCFTFVNVVEPVANFSSQKLFLCDRPATFYDSSTIIDGCVAETGFPCDQVTYRRWWFGDNGYDSTAWRSDLINPSYAYRKYGWYRVMQVIKTDQGCFDTARKEIFIQGPRPRIKLLSDTLGCTPYKIRVVSFPNDSGNVSVTPATLIRPGRSDGAYETILLNNPDTAEIIYDREGVYELTAVGYDTYPITLSSCLPVVVPDTAGGEQRIKIYVKNPYKVELSSSKDVVCVGEPFKVTNSSSFDTITKFRMYVYDETYSTILDTMFKTNFRQDTGFSYIFNSPGYYRLVMHSTSFIENTPKCQNKDTITVRAMRAKADLQIDSLGLPKFFIWNRSDSANASNYVWRVYNPDGSLRTEVIVPSNNDPFYNLGEYDLKNDTGTFRVCIWATTANLDYCEDSACKEISNNFQVEIDIPNVFTPNGDGSNDMFNIKIKGEEMYDLKIWNRWGGLVFESLNSKFMWNGKTQNTGADNPEGTYYFVLKYKLRGKEEVTVNGTITLIRD